VGGGGGGGVTHQTLLPQLLHAAPLWQAEKLDAPPRGRKGCQRGAGRAGDGRGALVQLISLDGRGTLLRRSFPD
jgi:hypothetical protein